MDGGQEAHGADFCPYRTDVESVRDKLLILSLRLWLKHFERDDHLCSPDRALFQYFPVHSLIPSVRLPGVVMAEYPHAGRSGRARLCDYPGVTKVEGSAKIWWRR